MPTGVWARVPWRGTDWRALRRDDVIEFDARAEAYLKGYPDRRKIDKTPEIDWRLVRPTKVVLVHDSLENGFGPATQLDADKAHERQSVA